MKKSIVLIATLSLFLCFIFLVGCNSHVHTEVIDAKKDATCTETGLTEGKHCSVCNEVLGKQEIIPASHKWNAGMITTEPDCTNEGIKTFTCLVCSNTKTEDVAATGHNFSYEWTTDKNATCVETGSKSHHCSICDEKTDITDIPATGHNYHGTYNYAEGDGSDFITYCCDACDDSYNKDVQPITIVIEETGYSSFNGFKKSVSFSVSASGGYGTLFYKFEMFSSESSTTPISTVTRDFDLSTTYGVQSAITVNDMVVQVTVKDEYGNINIARKTVMPA